MSSFTEVDSLSYLFQSKGDILKAENKAKEIRDQLLADKMVANPSQDQI